MNARDVMTPNPVTVTAKASVAEVLDLMRDLEIRHVPVVEGGALVGMLSDRDLAQFDISRLVAVDGALRHELRAPVVTVMSSDVIFVNPETTLGEVVELLIDHRIGAVPVISPDRREVVGIVSYIDVLRALPAAPEDG